MAPAAIPTANPIMKPILTRSKQLGWACPYGPTATGIWVPQKGRIKMAGKLLIIQDVNTCLQLVFEPIMNMRVHILYALIDPMFILSPVACVRVVKQSF